MQRLLLLLVGVMLGTFLTLAVRGSYASPSASTVAFDYVNGGLVLKLTGVDGKTLVEAMRFDPNTHAPFPGSFDAYFPRDLVVERYSEIWHSEPNFIGHRYRGTKEQPLAVQRNDILTAFRSYGYDGANLTEAADITVEVDGTPGLNDMPTRIVFWVTPDGKAFFERAMTISSDKSVTIPQLASASGLNFVCVDVGGKLVSQTTACR